MTYLLFYLISVLHYSSEPQFRETLEWKSTLIENNKKGKYTLLADSLGIRYRIKWDALEGYPNFVHLFVGKYEIDSTVTLSYVCLGKPLQFYTGNFFSPWVDVP